MQSLEVDDRALAQFQWDWVVLEGMGFSLSAAYGIAKLKWERARGYR